MSIVDGFATVPRWNLDRAGGIENGYSFLNATPYDFARLGLLMLSGGLVGGARIVPEEWLRRIATPVADAGDGWRYSAQWWHPPGYEAYGDVVAIGIHGQFVYVDAQHRVVAVKLSDQDEAALIDVFRSIAAST